MKDSNAVTLTEVRGLLTRWGHTVRVYGDNSIEGWGWPEDSQLKRMKDERAGIGQGRKNSHSSVERQLIRLQMRDLEQVSTVARFMRDLRPLQLAVMANLYAHRMSVSATALQIGAKDCWVHQCRREVENMLRGWLNGLRMEVFEATANQGVRDAA